MRTSAARPEFGKADSSVAAVTAYLAYYAPPIVDILVDAFGFIALQRRLNSLNSRLCVRKGKHMLRSLWRIADECSAVTIA